MAGENESKLTSIEFETVERADSDTPEASSGSAQSPLRAVVGVLVVVVGALAGLLWINSRSSEPAENAATPEVADPEDEGHSIDSSDGDTPPSALVPEVLSVRLSNIEVFDDQLFGLVNRNGIEVDSSPPLVSSPEGQAWSIVPTSTRIGDATNPFNYQWSELVTIGNDLGLEAFGPNTGLSSFVSEDGIDWSLFTSIEVTDPLRPFLLIAGTDAELIGFRFFDSGAVTCPGEADLTQMGPHVRVVTMDRTTGEMTVVAEDTFSLAFNFSTDALEISDGQIAGIYFDAQGTTARPCVAEDVADAHRAEFFIADAVTDTAERWTLPAVLEPGNRPLFLGEFASGSLRRFLFAWSGQLWTFQPDLGLGEWTPIWVPDPEVSPTQPPSTYMLSESRTRLYAIDGGELRIWDFVDSGGFLDVVDTVVPIEPSRTPPTDFSVARILYADDDSIIFAADTIPTWRVELPVELGSCERQLDEVQIRCLMRQ